MLYVWTHADSSFYERSFRLLIRIGLEPRWPDVCRVWDARNLSQSLDVLGGNIGAIRSIRFTSDGQFLATAEPADFVHIFDVRSDYSKRQELDFFGEISGMSFSPDTDTLFVGVWDRTYGSLLQYGRLYKHSYLDSLF